MAVVVRCYVSLLYNDQRTRDGEPAKEIKMQFKLKIVEKKLEKKTRFM